MDEQQIYHLTIGSNLDHLPISFNKLDDQLFVFVINNYRDINQIFWCISLFANGHVHNIIYILIVSLMIFRNIKVPFSNCLAFYKLPQYYTTLSMKTQNLFHAFFQKFKVISDNIP